MAGTHQYVAGTNEEAGGTDEVAGNDEEGRDGGRVLYVAGTDEDGGGRHQDATVPIRAQLESFCARVNGPVQLRVFLGFATAYRAFVRCREPGLSPRVVRNKHVSFWQRLGAGRRSRGAARSA